MNRLIERFMGICADDITIAVTVFDRRDYVLEAIRSALGQTVPVKVMVVEDCGPDPAVREAIVGEFGHRIEYIRNSSNRGLFDNWNACLEYCRTPWLSILHDDDLLRPHFVETMLQLVKKKPELGFYCGRQAILTNGVVIPPPPTNWAAPWREIDIRSAADVNFTLFPGHLFRVENALAVGGFETHSYFTGDWDMWFRLTARFGAVQSAAEVAIVRSHETEGRGTLLVERKGWKWALDNRQRKRNLTYLKQIRGMELPFERTKLLETSPISLRLLLRHAHGFTRRINYYNWWLFVHSRAPHWRYKVLQWLFRLAGPGGLRSLSRLLAKTTS